MLWSCYLPKTDEKSVQRHLPFSHAVDSGRSGKAATAKDSAQSRTAEQ